MVYVMPFEEKKKNYYYLHEKQLKLHLMFEQEHFIIHYKCNAHL